MHSAVLDSAPTSDAPVVLRRRGLTYSLDLQAPAELTVQPHVEIVHDPDAPAHPWELAEI